MIEKYSYSIGKPFPEEKYISNEERVVPRFTPASFDVILTLPGLTQDEKKALICDKFVTSLFVYKQVPFISFDFGIYTFSISLNIRKVLSFDAQDWIYNNDNSVIQLFLLESGTGNLINFRMIDFPLMTELKYFMRFQLPLNKEEIDSRIFQGEKIYSIKDMVKYAIFFGEVPESGIKLKEFIEDDLIF